MDRYGQDLQDAIWATILPQLQDWSDRLGSLVKNIVATCGSKPIIMNCFSRSEQMETGHGLLCLKLFYCYVGAGAAERFQ